MIYLFIYFVKISFVFADQHINIHHKQFQFDIFVCCFFNLFELSIILQELFLALASLSAIVFSVAFYEGKFFPSMKNYKELLLNTLLLNIVILTAFYHYMLFEYLPYTIIYAILLLSSSIFSCY